MLSSWLGKHRGIMVLSLDIPEPVNTDEHSSSICRKHHVAGGLCIKPWMQHDQIGYPFCFSLQVVSSKSKTLLPEYNIPGLLGMQIKYMAVTKYSLQVQKEISRKTNKPNIVERANNFVGTVTWDYTSWKIKTSSIATFKWTYPEFNNHSKLILQVNKASQHSCHLC